VSPSTEGWRNWPLSLLLQATAAYRRSSRPHPSCLPASRSGDRSGEKWWSGSRHGERGGRRRLTPGREREGLGKPVETDQAARGAAGTRRPSSRGPVPCHAGRGVRSERRRRKSAAAVGRQQFAGEQKALGCSMCEDRRRRFVHVGESCRLIEIQQLARNRRRGPMKCLLLVGIFRCIEIRVNLSLQFFTSLKYCY
jgi:hypothetical protein